MPDKDITYLLKEMTRTINAADSTAAYCLCQTWILEETLKLLKEQEAVEPKHNPLSPTDWFCGKCGMCISRFHDYCPSCGQAVKWE